MDVVAGPSAPAGTPPLESAPSPVAPTATPPASSTVGSEPHELRPAWCVLAAPLAIALAVSGVIVGSDDQSAMHVVGAVLVLLWALAGAALGVRRRHDRLGPIVLAGAGIGGVLGLAQALSSLDTISATTSDAAAITVRLAAVLLSAIAFHALAALPDGRLPSRSLRRAVAVGYVLAVGLGLLLCTDLDQVLAWPIALAWVAALAAGGAATSRRYGSCGAVDRRRIQWIAWGVAVAAEGMLVVIALQLLADWPDDPTAVAFALTGLVPLAVIAGTLPRMVARVDQFLTRTVELAGLTALVVGIYVVVVLGFGRSPDDSERSLLLLSMVAAALAALLYVPARSWLTERANRLVYGARVAPDETLRTFAQRLTRSIPLDELMLQLAENLRASMVLTSAEVWTGQEGHYELLAGVPHRSPAPILIGETERPVVARAGVSGGTWLDIWVPQLVGPSGSAAMRVAPIAHAGMLLGFIVVARKPDDEPFSETEDMVLTEIARQIGLALHNAQLDSALQASLDELRLRNVELQQSRARIVSAGDAERRKLERNLHDGAQQHLVALAVKLRLAADAVEDDPADAVEMIEEIKGDVQNAIAELRALAHGIFPPLLVSGGLAEALPAAAARAALPTTVELDGIGRHGGDVEAAVYFCTVEALQNAGKHAGDGANAVVRIAQSEDALRFEVSDDGVGFDATARLESGEGLGHGFVNMADRLGAIGGTVSVESAPGHGTTITGVIPLPHSTSA